jgi:protein MpaA
MLKEFGNGRDVVFFLAGIHGDETAGILLVDELARYLDRHLELLEGRKVLVMPRANPDGLAERTRQNIRGVDLNRNFPANNRTNGPEAGEIPLSEPEAWAIWQVIHQYRPSRVISVHQPLGCVDYDGPGEAIAQAMSEACGLPVRKLGARPGSLGSYGQQIQGIPIVTLELPEEDSGLDGPQLWARYGKALLVAITWQGR